MRSDISVVCSASFNQTHMGAHRCARHEQAYCVLRDLINFWSQSVKNPSQARERHRAELTVRPGCMFNSCGDTIYLRPLMTAAWRLPAENIDELDLRELATHGLSP